MIKLLLIALILVNVLTFLIYCLDRITLARSQSKGYRKEYSWLVLVLIGGSIGAIAGMYTFRHKTKHRSFVWGMPAILIGQILLIVLLFYLPFDIKLM